jgi:starvation-inducible outer membrane lipoprotein
MGTDGSCPSCGRVLNAANAGGQSPPVHYDAKTIDVRGLAGEQGRAPWHFKLLVVAVAGYLLWRVVQLIIWIF